MDESKAAQSGAGIVKLSKPFPYDGKDITDIPFDFNAVTGRAYLKIFEKVVSISPQTDPRVHLELFAIASGIPKTDLERLPFRDMSKVLAEAQAFFLETLAEA